MIKIKIWGASGSIPVPGPQRNFYGGNTPCIELEKNDDGIIILDAGTGLRELGNKLKGGHERIDILITHCHLDHIYGLGFFLPFNDLGRDIHLWGPPADCGSFYNSILKFLSPPLSPIITKKLLCNLYVHDILNAEFAIGRTHIKSMPIKHVNQTIGYRLTRDGVTISYLPDHEPMNGLKEFPKDSSLISGYELAKNADLLIHDSQFTMKEYETHIGWGHSAIEHAMEFAKRANVGMLLNFSHDPNHTDETITNIIDESRQKLPGYPPMRAAKESETIEINKAI